MKKSVKLLVLFLMLLLVNISPVKAYSVFGEQINAADQKLEEKLNELFPEGEISIDVSNRYNIDRYNNLPSEIKSATPYEEWIIGSVADVIPVYAKYFFGEDISVDTGIVYEDKKIYADGFFKMNYNPDTESVDIYAAYSYTVISGCVEGMGCGTVGGGAEIPISYDVNFVEPNEKILEKINIYKTKMKETGILRYDDLYWINMLLATDLKGIFGEQIMNSNSAKYLLSPITELDSDIEMFINNRLGCVSFIAEDYGSFDDSTYPEIQYGGEFPIFYKGVLYENIGSWETDFYIYFGNSINIPDTTQSANYISVVEKRINDYINNTSYEVKVTKTDYNVSDNLFDMIDEDYLPDDILDIYNLNIKHNGKSYDYPFVIKMAPESEIKVPTVNYLDKENNIIMETTSSDIPNNSVIKVNKIDEGTDRQKTIEMVLNTDKAISYDITLEGSNGIIKTVENGVVAIKIPIPEDFDIDNINVFFVGEDGKDTEEFEGTYEEIDGKKFYLFFTNHFSTYVLAEGGSVANPQTSDGILSSLLLGSISLIALFITGLYAKKNIKA